MALEPTGPGLTFKNLTNQGLVSPLPGSGSTTCPAFDRRTAVQRSADAVAMPSPSPLAQRRRCFQSTYHTTVGRAAPAPIGAAGGPGLNPSVSYPLLVDPRQSLLVQACAVKRPARPSRMQPADMGFPHRHMTVLLVTSLDEQACRRLHDAAQPRCR
jgi:hypothetical protein